MFCFIVLLNCFHFFLILDDFKTVKTLKRRGTPSAPRATRTSLPGKCSCLRDPCEPKEDFLRKIIILKKEKIIRRS